MWSVRGGCVECEGRMCGVLGEDVWSVRGGCVECEGRMCECEGRMCGGV